MSGGIRLDIYLENKLLLMSINFSPKTRYTYLKEQYTVCFPGTVGITSSKLYNYKVSLSKLKYYLLLNLESP